MVLSHPMEGFEALCRVLRSPRVEDGALRIGLHGGALVFECEETGVRFPTIGGVPCLFEDADAELARWVDQRDDFGRETSKVANSVLAQLAGGAARADVRGRLERLHRELERHRANVFQILEQADLPREVERAHSSDEHPRAINPAESRLDAYLHQVHRDWGWDEGHSEVVRAAESIEAATSGRTIGAMLVLGGGAARLPYELHRRRKPELTVVMDVDVLAVTIAKRVVDGGVVELSEFPTGPRDAQSMVVTRTLRAEGARDVSNFHLVFADGLHPPVADGAFDTVLTPWFIDQVPTDLAAFVPEVRRVLKPGGMWLNHGPLIYEPRHTMLMHRYTADEVRAILGESGFSVDAFAYEPASFLQSPASTRGRTETILTFCATKRETVETPRAAKGSAPWLADADAPIVAWAELASYQPPHPMFAAIIALLDGRRSARDIAAVMVEKNGLPQDAALGGVQAALAEMARATQDAE